MAAARFYVRERTSLVSDSLQSRPSSVVELGKLPDKHLGEKRIRRKFAEFWHDPVICPVCQSDDWTFGQTLTHLFHLSDLSKEMIEAYPVIHVVCEKCGYLMLFDATRLGLL
jgi:hypothetical protein